MRAYVTRRLLFALVLLWVVATTIFFSIYLLPGDPAQMILGGSDASPSPEQIALVRKQLGLDRPLVVQYVDWLTSLARGDMGRSLLNGRPVATDLAARLGRTIELIVPAVLLSLAIGVPAGVVAARRRGSWLDPVLSAVTLFGFSVPVFVIGPLLVYVFAIALRILPSGGYASPAEDLGRFLSYLILPAATLSASPAATAMRMTRSSVLEQMSLDYVRTARSKGLDEPRVVSRHVMRNAFIPVLSVLSLQVGLMFAGSVLIELIFNWPGMNTFLLNSVNTRDYPVIQSVVLTAAAIFVLVNLLTDLSYAIIDPRIRYS
jgi:peptide/nickel transport system permease protein